MDIEKLKELKELMDSGVLTYEEFEVEKAKILSDNTASKTETTKKNDVFKDNSKRNIFLIISCVLLLFGVFTCGKFFSGLFLFVLLLGHSAGMIFSSAKDQKTILGICILAIFAYFLLGIFFEYRGTGILMPIFVGIVDIINYLRINKLIQSGFIDKEEDADEQRHYIPANNYIQPTPPSNQGITVTVNTGAQNVPTGQQQNVPVIDKYDLLQRLKMVYDLEGVSKYEYEHEKYEIEYNFEKYSQQEVYNISVRYNQLLKIKQLYDSGAMKMYDWDREKYQLLHN